MSEVRFSGRPGSALGSARQRSNLNPNPRRLAQATPEARAKLIAPAGSSVRLFPLARQWAWVREQPSAELGWGDFRRRGRRDGVDHGHDALRPYGRVGAACRRVRGEAEDAGQGEGQGGRRKAPRADARRVQIPRRREARLHAVELGPQSPTELGPEWIAISLRHRAHDLLKKTPVAPRVRRANPARREAALLPAASASPRFAPKHPSRLRSRGCCSRGSTAGRSLRTAWAGEPSTRSEGLASWPRRRGRRQALAFPACAAPRPRSSALRFVGRRWRG